MPVPITNWHACPDKTDKTDKGQIGMPVPITNWHACPDKTAPHRKARLTQREIQW